MNKEEFIKILENLHISYNDEMLNQLEIYKDFLKDYNKHTNLTAIKNDEDIYLKHFYDSLTIVKALELNKIENLLDVGTGAGFPGMVIKIFYPHINVYLLDSNNKKIKFLDELSKKINVKVNLIKERVEEYAKTNLNKFDLVTSRAVANMRILTELCLPLVKKDGLFIALKGKVQNELLEAKTTIDFMNGEIINIISFELSKNSDERNIVVIKKNKESSKEILRPYDKIIKKPLKKNFK